MTTPSPRRLFDSYALPLSRPRDQTAAAVSFAVHVAIALLVVGPGAMLVENAWGGPKLPERSRAGGRAATVWIAMPQLSTSDPDAAAAQPPAAPVPTVARPSAQPVKLGLPVPARLVLTSTPAAMAADNGPVGDPVEGPQEGVGVEGQQEGVGTDSTGSSTDIFGPTPALLPTAPPGAPADEKGQHEVRFWIRADGRVSRIEVIPRIKDSSYRRRFMQAMSTFAFGPAKTRDGRSIEYVYSVVVYP